LDRRKSLLNRWAHHGDGGQPRVVRARDGVLRLPDEGVRALAERPAEYRLPDPKRHRGGLREPEPELRAPVTTERRRDPTQLEHRRLRLVGQEAVGRLPPARVARAGGELAEQRDHIVMVVEGRIVTTERIA